MSSRLYHPKVWRSGCGPYARVPARGTTTARSKGPMGPGRECENLGRLGDMGNNPRIDSYVYAVVMSGVIVRVSSTILTCMFLCAG